MVKLEKPADRSVNQDSGLPYERPADIYPETGSVYPLEVWSLCWLPKTLGYTAKTLLKARQQ